MISPHQSSNRPHADPVTIVGGGLAGMAAAVGLGLHGVPVALLESRDRLGGRASSFIDRHTGETIDNCQHVSMGCCTNLRHFCETVGIDESFRCERALTFIDPEGWTSRLFESALPAPLHLLPAFARLRSLTPGEKLSLALALRRLARTSPSSIRSESFRDWLTRHGQTDRLIERFWEVVLVSALSESLDRIDVGHARKVFVDGFLRNRAGWRVLLPTVPLDELYGRPVIDWLRAHGGDIRFQSSVRRLRGSIENIDSVELRDGAVLPVNELIVAVPHGRVGDLLPEEVVRHPSLATIARIECSPITSLHLWFARPIMDLPHAVLIGRLSQWVFQRATNVQHFPSRKPPAPAPQPPTPNPRFAYQVVISASRGLQEMSHEEIRDRVLAELGAIWPAARYEQLVHWRVVTEHRAVFSATPGIDALRPPQQSPVPNLQLAGDWTATGWPSTMESAVRSGYLAAENILRRLGIESQLLQPDLPTGWLSRMAFGFSSSISSRTPQD